MQLGIPSEVTATEIARERTLGGAIGLCAKAAGLEPKQMAINGKAIDKGQWSRWLSDSEGVIWEKLACVMDQAGNDAPLLWMLHSRGYDLASLRKRETETERELRMVREQLAKSELKNRVLVDALAGRVSA